MPLVDVGSLVRARQGPYYLLVGCALAALLKHLGIIGLQAVAILRRLKLACKRLHPVEVFAVAGRKALGIAHVGCLVQIQTYEQHLGEALAESAILCLAGHGQMLCGKL